MFSSAVLISYTYEVDEIGQKIASEKRITVPVEEWSVSRAEWHDAQRNSLNPDMMLTTNVRNYSNQTVVEYKGNTYAVYRTYHSKNGNNVELYLQRKAGIVNADD